MKNLLLVLGVGLLLSYACGGDATDQVHEHAESHATVQAKADVMRSSEEFIAARDALHGCLEALGYRNVGGPGLVLLDGSTVPPGPRFVRGALLDYEIHREECIAETGFDEVVAKHGLADEPPDPGRVRKANEYALAQMDCLAKKGYEIPEPKVLRGYLHFDFPARHNEEEVAYQKDLVDCNRQIWAADFPPAY